MRPLKITRYKQDPSLCAIASSASVANFFNRDIDYEIAKEIYDLKIGNYDDGLWSGEIGLLLNMLGFKKVTIICSDLDYSWKNLSKVGLIEELKRAKRKRSVGESVVSDWSAYYKFLTNSFAKNNIVIDYKFANYIKDYLDNKLPIIISFNWTMFFEFAKAGEDGDDPIFGEEEHHAVVVRGYNKKGVHVVDSQHRFYKYSRKKYRDGYYLIPWLELMTVMSKGDVIIPEEYDYEWTLPHELE